MRLIDADALKAYVNSLSTHPLNEWDTWGVLAAIDKQPTITTSPWRMVEEELPKKVGSYLTAYYDGFVCENQWHYIGPTAIGWVNDAEAVRYWMPLPEPPKEDNDG